jgi:hypothetical protein
LTTDENADATVTTTTAATDITTTVTEETYTEVKIIKFYTT